MSTSDSVLGALANASGLGVLPQHNYISLIRAAFQPAYWQSTQVVDGSRRVVPGIDSPRTTSEFTQMEANFALFWAVAIQAYEATLVSSDTPLDRFLDGDTLALTTLERDGLRAFEGQGRCDRCHQGAELTAAGVTTVAR